MTVDEIRAELFRNRDTEYRAFQCKLIPTVAQERVIGVRTPVLRKLAKDLSGKGDTAAFLNNLPHFYFDENQLHAFLISGIKDFSACLAETERFLPYVDNWATCDQLSPKAFKQCRKKLPEAIGRWIASGETYTVRFGIGMLMQHFLDADFDLKYPEAVASVRSEEYYIRMMVAWYFATALARQYEAVLPFLESKRLEPWTHNKTIQKAVESYRITPEQKVYLRSLKVRR